MLVFIWTSDSTIGISDGQTTPIATTPQGSLGRGLGEHSVLHLREKVIP